MFGKLRRNKHVAPVQNATPVPGASPVNPVNGATLAASTKASVDPRALTLVHSHDQASMLSRKALMAKALAAPPARTNSVLAHGLASRGVAGFAGAAAPLPNAITHPATSFANPAKGDVAWDSTSPR